jgi:RHS repeat-associated protein
MPNNSQESNIPGLYALQFGAGSVGSQGINLFRGNLAFPLKLISLPSLNNLVLDISLMYQSNVEYAVDKWNVEAPTDILGLGWSLPFDKIVIDPKSNGSTFDNKYYLVQGGQTEELVPIPHAWVRAILPITEIPLKSGKVSSHAKTLLAQHHIKVHGEAVLKKDPSKEEWILQDDHHQRTLILRPHNDTHYQLTSGGLSFELKGYRFWKISYYPEYEKWEIIKEDGSTYTFGGSGQEIRAGQKPNVLQYGIKWGNWIGNSTHSAQQERYVTAWNLAKVNNILGNYHIYNYQVIEQAVGEGSLTYTKECHVQEIKNDLGWSCAYSYQPMVYDHTSLDSPKEYVDPNKDPTQIPDTSPNAYQSRYTTQYLDKLTVYNASQEMQLYLQFEYYSSTYQGKDYEVINLTQKDSKNLLAYGATFKRYLKSVTSYYSSGVSHPGVEFYYHFTTDQSANRGALNKILYPSGGMDIFSYESISVGGAKEQDPGARNLAIKNPFEKGKNAARVWYGGDYVVCGWYNEENNQLKINIFTWIGRWHPSAEEWFTFTGPFDIDGIQLGVGQDIFLLALPWQYQAKTDVYLFNRRHLCNASWEIYSTDKGLVPHSYATNQFQLCLGEEFILFHDMDNKLMDRFAWNWMQRKWEIESLGEKSQLCQAATGSRYQYYVAAYNNYYIVLCYDQVQDFSKFTLYYRDGLLNWQEGSHLSTTDIDIVSYNGFRYFNFGLSDSFAGITYITDYTSDGNSFSAFNYQVKILTWDENFNNLGFAVINGLIEENFTNITAPILSAIGPLPVSNTLIGSGPNFFIYDGETWQANNIGIKYDGGFADLSTQYYWYAYSEDAILKTENTYSGIYSQLTYTDINHPNFGWKQAVLQDDSSPPATRQLVGYPTLIGSYLTQNTTIYNRSVYSNWDDLSHYLLTQVKGNIDTTTLINQAPYFIAFMTVDDEQQPLNTYILFFRNGDVIRDEAGNPVIEEFNGQQMTRLLNAQHHYQSSLKGKLPAIPAGFITFPNQNTLDQTDQITLHRYSNESVQGPIQAFVINNVVMDDGYQQIHKCFEYNDLSAAQDATGTIVRFHQVSEYLGVLDPKDQQDGYTTSYFYNGLPPITPKFTQLGNHDQAVHCYSMLDGTLIVKEQYDVAHTLVSKTEYTWTVATQVATEPTGQSLRNLYGGLPQVMTTMTMQDGVSQATNITYCAASGNQASTQTSYYTSTGESVTKQNRYCYAHEKYPELWHLNILDKVAQVQVFTKTESEQEYSLQSMNAQTYKKWPTQAGYYWGSFESYVANSPDAPAFDGWEGGAVSDKWDKVSSITARDSKGNVLSSSDNLGMITTNVYDDQQEFLIATFKNAADVSYDSFEPYQASSWQVSDQSAGRIISSDAFTGQCCFNLVNSGSLTRQLTLTQPVKNYVLSGFIKTPLGVDITKLAINLSITVAGTATRISKDLSLTNGEWEYRQWVVDTSELGVLAPNTAILLAINATFAGNDLYVRVDDLAFTPLKSLFGATVYNFDKLYKTASLTTNGNVSRTLYNLYDAPVGSIGTYGNVQGFKTSFLTRQTTDLTNGTPFPQATPNASIAVTAQDQGFYDEFKEDALTNYQFIHSAKNDWQVSNNKLRLVNASSAPLGAQLARANFTAKNLGIYVLVDSQQSNTVSLGTGEFFVVWNGTLWQLCQTKEGHSTVLQESKLSFEKEWMLLLFDNRLLFYANGIAVFNYHSDDLATSHQVILGLKQPGAFYNLLVAENISVSQDFADGTGKTLQSLHMESGEAVLMTAPLYDYLGRAAISLKPSRITASQVTNPFGYYPNYVTNGGVNGSIWQDLPAAGPIVDVYHPNDGGYPFSRTVYEASPLARPLKKGQAGVAFAISKDSSGKENPHIARYSYGTNQDQGSFLYPLPIGKYHIQTLTDPDGNHLVTYKDGLGNDIGSVTYSPDRTESNRFSQVHNKFGYKKAVIPPLYYATYPHRDFTAIEIPAMATLATYDYLGRLITAQDPDRGISHCIYDKASRPRFSQDALGAAQGYIYYIKYDELGRTIEQGYYVSAWDPKLLQEKANTDPSWPLTTDTWITVDHYDGDDTTPNMLGRIWYSLANNHTTQNGDVKETFTYDKAGQVLTQNSTVNSTPPRSCVLSYTYNPAGRQLTTTDDQTKLTAWYEYNAVGQLTTLSSTTDQVMHTQLAKFTYTQEGAIENYRLLPDNPTPILERSYHYNSPGWLEKTEDAQLSEALQYTQGACDNGGYYGGAIAHQAIDYKQGQPTQEASCYTVDYRNQIITAGKQSWQTDANGNFTQHTVDNTARAYTLFPGTNQLQSITTPDQSFTRQYQYNEIGEIHLLKGHPLVGMSFAYYRGSNRLQNIRLAGDQSVDQLSFGYGPGNQRVYKVATLAGKVVSQLTYFGGVEIYQDAERQEVKRYLSVPGATLIFYQGNYYVALKDHLNSTRVIIDPQGKVIGQYSYDTYGATSIIQPPPFQYNRLYTGQEYEPEVGLYNYKARHYDPQIGRFLMADPAAQFPSPYAYAANNPLIYVDPTGAVSTGWMVGAGVFGALAMLATVGIMGAFLEGGLLASVAIGAVSGAVGGAVQGGILFEKASSREEYSAQKIGFDVLAGFIGGIAGAFAGGMVGRGVVSLSLKAGAHPYTITAAATISSSFVGGGVGSFGAAAVNSAVAGHSLFSKENILSFIIGGIAGLGGALMASGAQFGLANIGGLKTIPGGFEKLGRLTGKVSFRGRAGVTPNGNRFISFVTGGRGFLVDPTVKDIYQAPDAPTIDVDVVDTHGSLRHTYPEVKYGGETFTRVTTPEELAVVLKSKGFGTRPIRLFSCHAAFLGRFSVAQRLANAMGKRVYATSVAAAPEEYKQVNWEPYDPKPGFF